MAHVCTENGQELNTEGQQMLIQFIAQIFKCGGCEKNFGAICILHEHLKNHSSGGSYYYDHVSKTAFPKLDLMCTATQTEWQSEGSAIAPLNPGIIVKTEIDKEIDNGEYHTLSEKPGCFSLHNRNSNSNGRLVNRQLDSLETFERLHQIKNVTCDNISCYISSGKSEPHDQRDSSDSENTITDYWYSNSELDHREETRKRKRHVVSELDKLMKKKNACLDTVRAKDHSSIESLQFECGEKLPSLDDGVSIKVEEGVKRKKERPLRTSRYSSTGRKSDGKMSRVKKLQRKNTKSILSSKISFKKEMKPLTGMVLDTRKNYRCDHCGKVYSTLPGLQYHNEAIHLKARVKCSVCDKEMATKYSLRNHMIEVHKLGAQKFRCDKCDRFFPYQYRLRDHMKLSHTTDKDLEACLVCEQCGMKFLTRQRFSHHMNAGCLHNRVRKYPCPNKDCQFVAFTKRGLSKHAEKHRPEDKYTCHICGAGFKHYRSSVNHQLVHTDERDFACKHCDKAFKSAMALRRHVFIHENNTRYKCKYCDRQFVQKSNLDAHLRQHTGVKPYKCDYCSEAFAHNVSRKNHMTKCHLKPLPYVSISDSKM